MALSSIFSNIEKVYGKLIKGAFDEAKKQGAESTDTLYYMMTTTGKVLFDIKDRRSLEDSLIKIGGDVIQGFLLKLIVKDGKTAAQIDFALIAKGYSLGDLLLTLKQANEVSFSQGYIYKPEGLMVQGVYMPGQYFRVGTITGLDGITKIYKDPLTGQFMSAEVISKAMYESVHPDYLDLYKYETMWAEVDSTVKSFNPQHIVSFEDGVLSVTFPDGHIEAKDLDDTDNIINGKNGNDVLVGMGGSDYLLGGTGYDTYISGNGDTIKDTDGSGRVAFEGGILTGGKAKKGEKGVYEGNGGTYTLSNGTLTFVKGSQTLTIQKFKNGDLGITLGEEKPKPKEESPNNNHGSPLVLDLNGDGVTSTFISETSTYFDLDNNGMKERTGWVQSTDGLLALDKNSDDVINDGNELFGNYTKDTLGNYSNNGFDALSKYDTNHDNVIDANDDVYKALQVWQDSNSDGITDTGELHSLSELGVSSINLTYQTTDTLEERNSIRQTSTFIQETTDTEGNTIAETKTVNDVWFRKDTTKIEREVA